MSPRTKEQNQAIREQTRQQIIDAAFELFANEGFTRTSISSIASKAAVSKGLIYHYFSSKKAILDAIAEQLTGLGEQLVDFPDELYAADKLHYLIDRTFTFIETQPGLGKLMISLVLQKDAFEAVKPRIDAINERQITVFSSILQELGYEDPALSAYELGAMFDGILLAYAAMGDEYPLRQIKQKILADYVPD